MQLTLSDEQFVAACDVPRRQSKESRQGEGCDVPRALQRDLSTCRVSKSGWHAFSGVSAFDTDGTFGDAASLTLLLEGLL